MTEKQTINCLKVNYGIEVTTLVFFLTGADVNASVYTAQAIDLTSYFVKVKRGHHHEISVVIAELLHDVGIQQIIPPISTLHGRAIHYIVNFNIIFFIPFALSS